MPKNSSARPLLRLGVGLTASALTAAGIVIAGAPAHAAQALLTPVDVNTDATRATTSCSSR